MTDELEILSLKSEWAWARDAGDIDGMMRCYAPEARTETGALGSFDGADAIRANWENRLAGFRPGTSMHQLTNGVVEVDGDTARGRWYLRVLSIDSESGELRTVSLGRYRDELRRIDGRWRFTLVGLETLWRQTP